MAIELARFQRRYLRVFTIAMDVFLLGFSAWGAFMLSGYGESDVPATLLGIFPLFAVPVFIRFGLYRAVLMYIGTKAIMTLLQAVTLHVAMITPVLIAFDGADVLRFIGSYWVVSLVTIGGSRVVMRAAIRWAARAYREPTRVAIYGAGSAGAELAEALKASSGYYPVAFVDDKRELRGHEILGLKVFATSELPGLIDKYGIKEMLLAIPSASQKRRREITRLLEPYPLHVKTVPPLSELVAGQSLVKEVRELDIEDILERPSVAPDLTLLERDIAGKSVMVTGAGGSIGSELCRQIMKLKPKRIVLFERSEYALYKIERELQTVVESPDWEPGECAVIPLLGSVTDERYFRLVLDAFSIQTLYHAAAYKHVPLVEYNTLQGIVNNVIGTWYCARSAIAAGVETFTLISTDKAVRPANVMGASKRMAEIAIQALASNASRTRFSIVRFGNVLGSSGSVVPLFRKQIGDGGPITITHPEITRYFMTIPEAAQLVIQAGAMGGSGDVFVLDMGDPVKIMDMARRMVALSGLSVRDAENPSGDIEIKVTALRPGEKLHEELVIGGPVMETSHSRIMRVKEEFLPLVRVQKIMKSLEAASERFDAEDACGLLSEATGYAQERVVDLLWGATGRANLEAPVARDASGAQ